MKYQIENNSPFGKAFKVVGGTHEVCRGKTEIVDVEGGLSDEKIEMHRAAGVNIKAAAKNAKVGPVEPEPKAEPVPTKTVELSEERKALNARAAELEITVPDNATDIAVATLIAQTEAAAAERADLIQRAEAAKVQVADDVSTDDLRTQVEAAEAEAAKAAGGK